MKTFKIILIVILALVVFLAIPLVTKDRSAGGFSAPALSEIDYSEVSFINKKENIKLGGMLMIPEGEGPFPAVVIIQGSGPSMRGNGWYTSVVKYLQDNGIVVLIPDKRGCDKSEGNWRGANFEQLGEDALAAVDFIKEQNQFKFSSIGLLGMSQGGWIAPVAATKRKDISYLVSMSGTSVTTHDQLFHEEVNNMAPYTYKFVAKSIAPLTVRSIKKREYYQGLIGFDPVPYLKKLSIPMFFAFGDNDKNVPVEASIERIKSNNLNGITYKVYPQGHGIIHPEYEKINEAFLKDLKHFVFEHTNVANQNE